MKKLSFALFSLFLFCSISLNAVDFGLVFSQGAKADVPDFNFGDGSYDISGVLLPRITALVGDTGDLYVSAAVNYETIFGNGSESLSIIPELTRTDYAFRAGSADVRIGRMFYGDPLGLIANNLFDGVRVSFFTNNGDFHAGAWYTGLLYKETAAITMTESEMQSNKIKFDFDNFSDTYFAPSHVLAAFDYNHSSLAGFIGLNVSLLTQFGLESDKISTHYIIVSASFPGSFYIFDLGGEIFGKLIWNLSTGARLNFGTGVFLPSLGDANPQRKYAVENES